MEVLTGSDARTIMNHADRPVRNPATRPRPSGQSILWRLLIFTALACCAAAPVPAAHEEPTRLTSDIPAMPLAKALDVFSRQTGVHLIYVSELVRTQVSHPVTSGLVAGEALRRLLQGTGLRSESLTPHSLRILAARPDADEVPAAAAAAPPALAEVIVTGTRIQLPVNTAAAGPMQVVTAQDVQFSGHTDAAEIISALPQMTFSSATDFGNHPNPSAFAGGFTTADLRGLRPQRTIVLVNGRRLGVGDPNTNNPSPAPDLDQIPLPLVERVEVLTGGASATYGADAVAGVVNFILKDHVQGIQVDGRYGLAEHTQHNRYIEAQEAAVGFNAPTGRSTDGYARDLSVLAGTSFRDGAGALTGYFIYHNQDAVRGAARDFAACPAYSDLFLTGGPDQAGISCVPNFNANIFVTDVQSQTAYSVLGNQFVPWPATNAVPSAFFDYSSYQYLQRSDERYQAGALGHLELGHAARAYLELTYMHDRTRTAIAPSGLFIGENPVTADGGYLVNCSNPLLSAQQAAILCTPAQIAADQALPGSVSADVLIGRRNIEGGDRIADYEHQNYRVVGGIKGPLGDDWSYNAYALYYRTSLAQVNSNYLSTAAVSRALQVSTDPQGRPVCISGGSCVPYDIFGSGAVTARQLAYLYTVGTDHGSTSEQMLEAEVTGQLARYGLVAPLAHEGITVNAGASRRSDGLRFAPDAIVRSGDMSGFDLAVAAVDHSMSVNEAFVEMRAPLVQDHPHLHELTLDAGYRFSDYSFGKTTSTYKFNVLLAPISALQLRVSYDRAIRTPNLIELYTPLSFGVSGVVSFDPCAPTDGGATHAAASLAQCLHTGVTAAQYGDGLGPAFGGTNTIPQCRNLGCVLVIGGNPTLAPETADTWSLGLTWTPSALPALAASVDYFHIDLKGEIGIVPESVTLQQCLTTADPAVCSQIVRTAAGSLSGATLAGGGYILGNAVNTGQALVSGIDVQGTLRPPLPGRWGALSISLTGSWLQHNGATPYRGATGFDCAGLFGNTCLNGSVNPRWRHNLRVTWELPGSVQLSAQWRFIGKTHFDNNSPQPLLLNQEEGAYDPYLARIPNYSYLDLSGTWAVERHLQLRVTINNAFDKDPPLVPTEASGATGIAWLNTFPAYDILGRSISVGFRAEL